MYLGVLRDVRYRRIGAASMACWIRAIHLRRDSRLSDLLESFATRMENAIRRSPKSIARCTQWSDHARDRLDFSWRQKHTRVGSHHLSGRLGSAERFDRVIVPSHFQISHATDWRPAFGSGQDDGAFPI